MKKTVSIVIAACSIVFFSCDKNTSNTQNSLPKVKQKNINPKGNTIKERFIPPNGFYWTKESPASFGEFLVNFKLKPYRTPILRYDQTPITTQNLHKAIYDIETGEKDLQQCADAVIRLRAEYLWKNKRFSEIAFHFTSGDLAKWSDYEKGIKAFVSGNQVTFRKTEGFDYSYQNFRNYLDLVFTYAGTISLNKETKPITDIQKLKTGDILITPGSPGHVVFIAGVCQNKDNKKLFLIGEGFTPAQSIHVLSNPFNSKISPWYEFDTKSKNTATARYFFKETNFRSF